MKWFKIKAESKEEVFEELKEIKKDLESDKDLAMSQVVYLQSHKDEVLEFGDIELAQAANIEEEEWDAYLDSKVTANKAVKADSMVSIPMEDYIEILRDRYQMHKEWQTEGNRALLDQYLDLIADSGLGSETSPSVVMDNYMVNGEIVSKNEFTATGNYSNKFEEYDGNWEDFCENEGVIYNDEYCALSL